MERMARMVVRLIGVIILFSAFYLHTAFFSTGMVIFWLLLVSF
jgi:hypothetical protein